MIMTLVSIAIVMYYNFRIWSQSAQENQAEFGLTLSDDNDFNWWDLSALPLFMCGFHNIYEGNVIILNLYAEL